MFTSATRMSRPGCRTGLASLSTRSKWAFKSWGSTREGTGAWRRVVRRRGAFLAARRSDGAVMSARRLCELVSGVGDAHLGKCGDAGGLGQACHLCWQAEAEQEEDSEGRYTAH